MWLVEVDKLILTSCQQQFNCSLCSLQQAFKKEHAHREKCQNCLRASEFMHDFHLRELCVLQQLLNNQSKRGKN